MYEKNLTFASFGARICVFLDFVTKMALIGEIYGFELGGEGGDDEATESAVELVGRSSVRGGGRRSGCAEELGIGASKVLVGGFAVLDVTVLPIRETFGVKHFELAERDSLRESADSTLAALGKRSGVRVHDSVSVRATVAGAHDDTFFAGEFATKMIKRKCGFNVCHIILRLLRSYTQKR